MKSDCNSNSSITPSLCGIDRYQAKLSKQQKEIEEIDNIHFYVEDSADPPNRSNHTLFVVQVAPVDDQLPYLYPNSSLQVGRV